MQNFNGRERSKENSRLFLVVRLIASLQGVQAIAL
jgi:hypothetical protein